MTLRSLCTDRIFLQENDIQYLEEVNRFLPMMAELAGADVFIDCLLPDQTAIVVAEAKPINTRSAYKKNVVGFIALEENEPAVFNAFSSGMPVRDIKAITQENCSVSQSVVPLRGGGNDIIAVLIMEKDISKDIQLSQKYQQLVREKDTGNEGYFGENNYHFLMEQAFKMLEVNHRIKNHLQIVASILNLQARKSKIPEIKNILLESVNRILSISAIHDILSASSANGNQVSCNLLFRKLVANFSSIVSQDQAIDVMIEGDDILLSTDKASAVSIVVNELLTNALTHAFVGRESGLIKITAKVGNLYNFISVEDTGIGFDFDEDTRGLGLDIIRAMVQDSLNGTFHYYSSSTGTKVIFDFPN